MRTTMKKLLALAVCAIMVVGVFAACGKKPADETPDTPKYDLNATSGVIVINAGAIFSIRYNTVGEVDGITGDNDAGVIIMEEYTDYEGKATTEVIKELIGLSAEEEALTENITTLLMKITSGTVFNTDELRETLVKAAQEALTEVGSKAIPWVIDEENLTGEGYLTLATVKTLIMNHMGVDKFDAFYGDTLPSNYSYIVTVEIDGVQTSYSVDAFYGFISIATQEELLGDTAEDEYMGDEPYVEPSEFEEDPIPEEPVQEEDGDIEIPID